MTKKVFIRIIISFIFILFWFSLDFMVPISFFLKDLWVMFVQARPSSKNF